MIRCSLCARPSRRGHGRAVVGTCECGATVCDRHARLVGGMIMCVRCSKKLDADVTIEKVRS